MDRLQKTTGILLYKYLLENKIHAIIKVINPVWEKTRRMQ